MCERDHGILLEARHPLRHSLQQHTEETGKQEKESEREKEAGRQGRQGEGLDVGEGLSWLRKSLFKINTESTLKTDSSES